jgi:hypothetical protein
MISIPDGSPPLLLFGASFSQWIIGLSDYRLVGWTKGLNGRAEEIHVLLPCQRFPLAPANAWLSACGFA